MLSGFEMMFHSVFRAKAQNKFLKPQWIIIFVLSAKVELLKKSNFKFYLEIKKIKLYRRMCNKPEYVVMRVQEPGNSQMNTFLARKPFLLTLVKCIYNGFG